MNSSLNTIFYGPPGTGKTYNIIRRAVEICDGADCAGMDYAEIRRRYRKLEAENRIKFITFHQSYGYEDFIESIKPVMSNGAETLPEGSGALRYEIVDGVFKDFCKAAEKSISKYGGLVIRVKKYHDNQKLWLINLPKLSDLDEWFEEEDEHISVYGNGQDSQIFTNFRKMKTGDYVVVRDKSEAKKHIAADRLYTDVLGIAEIISEDVTEKFKSGCVEQAKSVKWLFKRNKRYPFVNIEEKGLFPIEQNACIDIREGWEPWRGNNQSFWEPIYSLSGRVATIKAETACTLENYCDVKNFVFIIDEINRGNISKIFGELITLIEDNKRGEQLAVLPYSRDPFTVPKNVYILGTMNSADRSIALMDTALRRRFDFEEMLPKPGLFKDTEVDGVKIEPLLKKLNARVEVLLDREHTIGHAFFAPLIDDPSFNRLREIFKKKIIPLLQEYFYDDYARINAALNDNGFIRQERIPRDLFPRGFEEFDLPEKRYEINEDALNDKSNYIKIYE